MAGAVDALRRPASVAEPGNRRSSSSLRCGDGGCLPESVSEFALAAYSSRPVPGRDGRGGGLRPQPPPSPPGGAGAGAGAPSPQSPGRSLFDEERSLDQNSLLDEDQEQVQPWCGGGESPSRDEEARRKEAMPDFWSFPEVEMSVAFLCTTIGTAMLFVA